MLRHIGEKRSYSHNIRLAVLLSLNAGFINASGFLAFSVLTTNVTGHAALLAVYMAAANLRSAGMVALWLCLFLFGAFASSVYISIVGKNKTFAYSAPILMIILILIAVAALGSGYDHTLRQTEIYAGSLLFAMGVQNAMVSMISGSVVRTTHLTGMVTDLGIDLAAIMAYRNPSKSPVKRRIYLRLSIIFPFLIGGIIGGIIFSKIKFEAFYIPVLILLITLFYDYFRVKIVRALHNTKMHRQG